jgi:hypothetical protein
VLAEGTLLKSGGGTPVDDPASDHPSLPGGDIDRV